MFLYSLPCSAAGNIRLVIHQQRVHSFYNKPEQTQPQTSCLLKYKSLLGCSTISHVEVDQRFRGAYCLQHQKLFIPYLETKENDGLTAARMVYVKPQIGQLNAQHTF
jgi:hypothetical protein